MKTRKDFQKQLKFLYLHWIGWYIKNSTGFWIFASDFVHLQLTLGSFEHTAQKLSFLFLSFRKSKQIHKFLHICSHLLNKSFIKSFIYLFIFFCSNILSTSHGTNTMFPSYCITVAPFQFSYRISLLFLLDQIFFRMCFSNGEDLERSDSKSDSYRRSRKLMETHLERYLRTILSVNGNQKLIKCFFNEYIVVFLIKNLFLIHFRFQSKESRQKYQ